MIYTRDSRPDTPWDARVYLARYPDGPWASKAQWVIAVEEQYAATGDNVAHDWSHHRWVRMVTA